MTLNDLKTNKGQSHSFWYQSISHMRLPVNSNFWSRAHCFATIRNVIDRRRRRRRQTYRKRVVITVGYKRLKFRLWNFHRTVAHPSSFCGLSFIQKFWRVPYVRICQTRDGGENASI